jgi:carbon-monoxide dehydrogenase large subunit
VLIASDINPRCEPFIGVALHRPGHRSAPQRLLAADRAVWQGQPVAVVVADSRAEAEDAAELVTVDWQPLPVVGDQLQAIAPGAPIIHPELADNVAFDFSIEKGEPAKAFAEADLVIEEELRFERQMAMTLEARGLIADFDPSEGTLTVIHAHQSPFQMQDVFSRHLHIPEHKVRVTAPDIGGAFGMKLNIYSDEIATVVASMVLGRPVKFCADRLESFVSDAQARDHRLKCRIALKKTGEILAMEMDDIGAVGAYGMPLRFNVAEGMMAITIMGAPYSFDNYKARTRSVYVNKNLIGMYRGVGMPLACIATELLTDLAADKLGIDTVEFKRRTYRPKASLPCVTPGGQRLETVSFHECLEKLVAMIDYDALRKEQGELRKRGVHRGIGIATFCEQTAYGPPYYGPSGAPISTQDGCTLRLEPSGSVRCITSLTDQGQGTLTSVAQIVADSVGVSIDLVSVVGGDSSISPDKLYYMANGVQASYVDVDCDTGFIRILGQWAVDDCGRVINPLLVDEQVRGGIVQGIGAVLFEECVYSEDANLLNGTMADYLVPMANEMPDIVVAHVETPETSTKLGAKGIGEAGLIGAMGSVWVAVNDALKPLGAKVLHQPFTPERVLDALARARDARKQRGD